jgi:hypothetical protein
MRATSIALGVAWETGGEEASVEGEGSLATGVYIQNVRGVCKLKLTMT